MSTSAVIVRKARTAWRVLGRIRTDGRMPPASRQLAVDAARSSVEARLAPTVARVLPARGAGPAHRHRWRRWAAAPAPAESVHDMQHSLARDVVTACASAGAELFATASTGQCVEFGLDVRAVPAAIDAVDALGAGWFVRWWRGGREGVVAAGSRRARRVLRRADTWQVFRLAAVADGRLVGFDAGPRIGLWAPGVDDRMERVGIRGLTRFPAGLDTTVETVDGREYPSLATFAVGRSIDAMTDPVDVVITWVDGDDPAWRLRRSEYTGETTELAADAVHEARFRSRDELRYVLRSIALYAGWVRRIHLVTADQRPDWLVDDDRLRVVSHDEIFPADWLPTFNSHAIESRLHHVPDLAEHFVYFNDDTFLGRPVDRSLFFTPNGLPRFFIGEGRVDVGAATGALGVDASARNGRTLIESRFGRVVEHKLLHTPHALRRDVLADLEHLFPEEMERTGTSRLRAPTDLSVASSFAQYVGFCTGRCLPGPVVSKYVNIENANVRQHLDQIRTGRFDVFCLNATEQVLLDESRVDAVLADFLASYFPVPSPWERP